MFPCDVLMLKFGNLLLSSLVFSSMIEIFHVIGPSWLCLNMFYMHFEIIIPTS